MQARSTAELKGHRRSMLAGTREGRARRAAPVTPLKRKRLASKRVGRQALMGACQSPQKKYPVITRRPD